MPPFTISYLSNPTNSNLEIVISPTVLTELLDSIDRSEGGIDETIKFLVQEIISRAKIFVARFEDSYFLKTEPIHEFVGLEFRSQETSLIEEAVSYRLILKGGSLGIFSLSEVPIDDMYDIRLVIAESQLPEYQ